MIPITKRKLKKVDSNKKGKVSFISENTPPKTPEETNQTSVLGNNNILNLRTPRAQRILYKLYSFKCTTDSFFLIF